MGQYYLESILVFGMVYAAWQIWKLWMPTQDQAAEDEADHAEDPVSENTTTDSLFDAISRWGFLSPPDPDDEDPENPHDPNDSEEKANEDS